MKLKKKKPYINRNAGNVEANVAFFNNAATGGNMMGEEMKSLNEESKRYYYDDAIDYIEGHGISCDPAGHYEGEYTCDLLDDYSDGYSPKYDEHYYYKSTLNDIIKRVREYLEDDYDNYKELIANGEELDERDLEVFNYISKVLGKEGLKENLNNVVDTEEKSREIVQPDFAAGVREIKDNEEKVDELQKVRKAPETGKETLSNDIKFTLDESLFDRDENNESIKNVRAIKRIKDLKEEDQVYTIKEYLDDIKYGGEGWVTIDKIEFDIDQGDYHFSLDEVLNYAIKHNWVFKMDPEEGLVLISYIG